MTSKKGLKHAILLVGLLLLTACGGDGGSGGFTAGGTPGAGDLDTAFDGDGRVVTDTVNHTAVYAMAIQADGKIILGGSDYDSIGRDDEFAINRYSPSGSLDLSLLMDFSGDFDRIQALIIQPDGKIVVAGYAGNGTDLDFALARFNSDGSLDPTFGSSGKVTTGFYPGKNDSISAIALDAAGNIVVAGYADNGTNKDFALARFLPDGSLDTTFNPSVICSGICNGKAATDISDDDVATAIALDAAGKIIVAGHSSNGTNSNFTLTRYATDGTLDTGFGTGGKVMTDFAGGQDRAYALAIDGSGRLLVAGTAYAPGTGDGFALTRYDANGNLDTTFNSAPSCSGVCNGLQLTDFEGGKDGAYALVLDGSGRIVVAGFASSPTTNKDFALARYNAGGSLDTGFGTAGTVMTDFFGYADVAKAVALDDSGRIVVAGSVGKDNSIETSFALARYLP